MRLKSIKLAGFKSFVDATTVSFPHNMTAIVGPNGCGKSNVIDAVRWVMGESSAKNLRGESMTDVIFNGSTARQPVGQASIELVFDNSSGKLTGEYAAFNEISIRRKVTREGVSQYYLNGSKCRRRDVTDIFLGTGMGPRSYAIIEQGMISRLIESKPEELRVYLEEAAGISKYKERRRETENRIARTQENLDRLSDIRDELGKQLAHLQRQANAAQKYKEYKQQERSLRAKLNALSWKKFDAEAEVLRRSISSAETAIEKAVLARTENEGLIEKFRLKSESLQDHFSKIQAKYYESGAEIARLEQEIKFRKERSQQRTSALAKLGLEHASVKDRIRQTSEELMTFTEQSDVILPELDLVKARLEEVSEAFGESTLAMEEWQGDWEQFEQNYQSSLRKRDQLASELTSLEGSVAEKKRRIEKLESEKRELEQKMGHSDGQELLQTLAQVEANISRLEEQCQENESLHKGVMENVEAHKETRSALQSQISEQQAILASLNTLQASALERSQNSNRKILEQKGIDPDNRLYSALKLDAKWEFALEHVLGDLLTGLCASEKDLETLDLGQLQNSQLLLDPSFIPELASEDGGETLATVCQGAPFLQPLLSKVFLAENQAQALARRKSLRAGESIITPEAYWYGENWVRAYKPSEEESGLVQREQQIKEAQSKVVGFQEQLDDTSRLLGEGQDSAARYKLGLDNQLAELRARREERSRILAEKSAYEARNEQRKLRLGDNLEELSTLREELSELHESIELSRESMSSQRESAEDAQLERERRLERKTALQKTSESLSADLRKLQSESHALELSQQKSLSQRNLLEMSLARLQEDEARIQSEHEELAAVEEDDGHVEVLAEQLEGLLDRRLSIESRLAEARTELEKNASDLKEAEQLRLHAESGLQEQRSELERLRMEKQAVDINQAGLKEKVQQDDFDLGALIAELSEEETEASISETLGVLGQRIQRLGAINLAAVDEYKEQSERKTYLDAQDAELNEALETLLAAIRKIDKETRARFKETYELVNEGLQRLFPRIFGGGSAKLELTEDDLLETGVSIIARPPGKKNSTIHLLSGGEKALTAIALIFAIFELNPAPFCMLDEVDAPLDDANVGRFANMVKQMSDRVQFIYISHNKVSMEKADQLMGVTMSEPGVSRLVSVDVDEAVSLAEA